ncbi:hypothetical protein [Roseospira goensis]|uniref:Uncharacterized protein n=1 Tax=Roseospira goensis TaxID=391922 RepID=A0A7W6WJT7_9PROT|nr:hypothetical protein [Roseospira goensis]MBB4284984.1 hypothetical protein [Roseospira goensis]
MDVLDEEDRIRDSRRARHAEARRERRLAAAARQAEELERFLDSLGRRIDTLAESGHVLEGDAEHPPRFIDYARTRRLTSECMAFMIVIERRIEALPEDMQPAPRDAFETHTITLWGTLLECSLAFLRAISEEEHLPLGSREVFLHEIKTLHDAHGTLSQERFAERLPPPLLGKHRQAEKILNEIIDRAPRLLDLG